MNDFTSKGTVTDPEQENPKKPVIPEVDNSSSWLLEGATSQGWSANFEEYVGKVFAPAYDQFEKDDEVRKITNDAKLNLGPKAALSKNLRTKLGANYSEFLLDDERYNVDMSKYADDYNMPSGNEFKVYEPKYSTLYSLKGEKPLVSVSRLEQARTDDYKFPEYDHTKDLASRGYAFEQSVRANPGASTDATSSYRNRDPGRHIMIDCSKIRHRKTDMSPTSYALTRSDIRTEDSRIMGTDFIMLNLRPADYWYEKVDKLLKEARDTNY